MLVRTTTASKALNVKISEFGAVVGPGIEFEVTEQRYKVLHGGNKWRSNFVEAVTYAKTPQKEEIITPQTTLQSQPENVDMPEAIPQEEPEVEVIKPKKKKTSSM